MSTEPLNVQTALALGWKGIHQDLDGKWWGIEPHGGLKMTIPPYSTSWCSAGALVNRFKIGVGWESTAWIAQHSDASGQDRYADGVTPTEAICKLVVHLHRKGSLENGL